MRWWNTVEEAIKRSWQKTTTIKHLALFGKKGTWTSVPTGEICLRSIFVWHQIGMECCLFCYEIMTQKHGISKRRGIVKIYIVCYSRAWQNNTNSCMVHTPETQHKHFYVLRLIKNTDKHNAFEMRTDTKCCNMPNYVSYFS